MNVRGLTAAWLQRELIKEVSELTKDIQTKAVSGDDVLGTNGYAQSLPAVTEDEEDISQFFPYHIVRLEQGTTKDDTDPWTVTVNVLFGVHDTDTNTEGHYDVMEMIQRVVDRFCSEPCIGNFRAQPEITWLLQEEDTYPYYFGAVELKFTVAKMVKEDSIFT